MEEGKNDKAECTFLSCTKFFNCIHISLSTQKNHGLENVSWDDKRIVAGIIASEPDVNNPDNVIFSIQLLMSISEFDPDLHLVIQFVGCGPISTTLGDIAKWSYFACGRLLEEYESIIKQSGYSKLLDIGGRARSGVLYADRYRNKEVVVLDILPGDGVDVVCDAHNMSSVFPHGYFDAIFSVAVFEHLIMPWKVALEMNRVMRIGAVGFIVTHQTVGMHDRPWDYFRYSDTAWKGMFNRHTGFEILGTELGDIQYIIPHTYQPRYHEVEKTGGHEYSAVLVRKIAETNLDWPLIAKDVTEDVYPT